MDTTNVYQQERRQKLQKLRDLGVDPYGSAVEGIETLARIKEKYRPDMGHDGGPVVKAAGRVMLKRDMGKLSFLTLRDESGDLQVALDKKRVDDQAWALREMIDLGDLIVVEGPLGVTNRGEVTVWGTRLTMAAKALLPPPAKWEGLSDVELRYRQRYVDLWANPQVMRVMKTRMRIVDEIRRFMAGRGFVEVETPMMQPIPGGAAARPFLTHHEALDIPLYLRVAPELYLKRLLVGGFGRIFELNRNFRNEGISPRHNPEFTMLEAYEAFGSWRTMADMVEDLICTVAQNVIGGLTIEHKDAAGQVTRTINLNRPWRRVRATDLVAERTGWHFDGRKLQDAAPGVLDELRAKGARASVADHGAHEQLVETYEKLVEPTLIDPCFVTHLPSAAIPLAKESAEFPGFAEVYELAIGGMEISPGYSELNDPEVQERHFAHQAGPDDEKQRIDEDFLNALRYGMPPAGGMGMGIDRLVAMLTGSASLRDVILFPLMRPHEGS